MRTAIVLGLVHDFRGVPFTAEAFADLRDASSAALRSAEFDDATFGEGADFDGFEFTGKTSFKGARFHGRASFENVRFFGEVSFVDASFAGSCSFDGSTFHYDGTVFASQPRTVDRPSADFARVACAGHLSFRGVWVAADWNLSGARIDGSVTVTARCEGSVILRDVRVSMSTWITLNAPHVDCRDSAFDRSSTLRLSNATLTFDNAMFGARSSVAHHPGTLTLPRAPDPGAATRANVRPRVVSMRHVDVSPLLFVELDLRTCLFADVHNLDQLRFRSCRFEEPSPGRFLGMRTRPVRRRVIADEVASPRVEPSSVAALYRQLRKALEEGKNEPGASDFYYGEMEMRRLPEATETTPAERFLLHVYWGLSGYGMRAMRALGWLLVAVTATVALMMGLGLPDSDPQQIVTGTLPSARGRVVLRVDSSEPELTLAVHDRFSAQRANSALRIVLNSVVFRSSGQNLTPAGAYIEMVSRFAEPLLITLAALAVLGRIKRG
ncbi:hypothetical protein G3I40_15875 [Streptomyces sp. SID14478]|uniref:pentapeptide repeat-containing protein n=1 Tax=Streptomyces sp. SID14478 TaxID=2706073 RepID=UPI0013DBABA7|nr:hypothetical protein [Streptomyces sp. SID14478]